MKKTPSKNPSGWKFRIAAVVAAVLVSLASAAAQEPPSVFPMDQLAWDIPAITIPGATVLDHRFYVDGATKATPITPTCTPALPPTTCRLAPTLTSGPHSIIVTYRVKTTDGRTLESEKSVPFTFAVILGLSPATGLRIEPAGTPVP